MRASFNFQPVLRFGLKRGIQEFRIGNKYDVYNIIYILERVNWFKWRV